MMGMELFKYIFDESKKDDCKGVVSIVIKFAAFFICLSPVMLYFVLYQREFIEKLNIILSSTLIVGISCIYFFIIFALSQAYSTILLKRKLVRNRKNTNNQVLTEEYKQHYYYSNSFKITTFFQSIVLIVLICSYMFNNYSNSIYKQFMELKYVVITIILYIVLSVTLWIRNLYKYIQLLKQHSASVKEESDLRKHSDSLTDMIKTDKKLIDDLENLKDNINKET